MRGAEELVAATLAYAEADRNLTSTAEALAKEVDASGHKLRLALACQYAEALERYDRCEKRLRKAARRVRRWF